MRQIQTTIVAACAALALTAGAATAQTVPPDRLTYVTFSGPVSIPGMTLPAGTYEFKIIDSNTNRNVVQIFNREGTKLFTTLLAIPATRMQPSGDPVITFKETASNQPPAVHYWYYAGDLAGNELVYPKNQAQMIANASGESVMSVDSNGNSIDDWKSGSISKVKPDNTAHGDQQSSSKTATSTTTSTTTADQGSPKPATTAATTTTADQKTQPTTTSPSSDQRPSRTMDQSAQPTTAPSTVAADTSNSNAKTAVGTSGRSRRLPKTASELPMVGLIGLIALGGALALRVARTA
jgi:cobalamin biosynthesis Mg chelatase CobN